MQLTAFSSLGDCYQCFLKLIDESFLTNSIVVRQIFVSLVDQRTNQCLKVRHQFHGHACGSLFISPNTLSYSTLLKTTNSKRYKF